MSYYLKDPQSRVDYAIDWTAYLDGQSVSASSWSVTPDGEGAIAVDQASFGLTRSAVRLSGGTVGCVYSISNQVTFSDGSRDERSITLRVEQR
jgi:hypothetical protein